MPKQRRLDSETKDEAVKLLKLRANKKLLQNHLMSTTGKTVTLKDLHNIAARNVPKFRNDFRELLQFILQFIYILKNIHIDQELGIKGPIYVSHSLSTIRQGNSMPRKSF